MDTLYFSDVRTESGISRTFHNRRFITFPPLTPSLSSIIFKIEDIQYVPRCHEGTITISRGNTKDIVDILSSIGIVCRIQICDPCYGFDPGHALHDLDMEDYSKVCVKKRFIEEIIARSGLIVDICNIVFEYM